MRPIDAQRVDADTLRALCPYCRTVHNIPLDGHSGCGGWWLVYSSCDCNRAFYAANKRRRKLILLRVPAEAKWEN